MTCAASPDSPAFTLSMMRYASAGTSTPTRRSLRGPGVFWRSYSSKGAAPHLHDAFTRRAYACATWANVREHAVDRLDYWGSRGRGFKSRRPDEVRFQQLTAWRGRNE